jgi:exopolysaccharide biosynthesis protein
MKSETPILPTPTLTPTIFPNAIYPEWQLLAPGLEFRIYVPNENTFAQIWALRIDPSLYTFRAHYRPGESLTINEWRNVLPGVVALVNANLFQPDFTVNGLLVTDGVSYGSSYMGYGGMFQLQNGLPRVRSLILEPYLGESLEQAIQAFPMLVVNGDAAYLNTRDVVTRRTVVAQDMTGRIILMATPLIGMTLADLSAYLVTTDMEITNALNLDGGGSTMIFIQPDTILPSFDAVPAVLAVYAN